MFSSLAARAAGCLLASFTIFFLTYPSVRFWLSGQSLITANEYPKSLTAIFSTESIDALNRDPRFQNALLSLTAVVAHSSADLGRKFGWEELTSFGTNLTDGVDRVRSKQQYRKKRRGVVDEIGITVQGLVGDQVVGQNSSCGLSNLRSCVGDIFTDSIGTSALFLGIGLGMGAATSLNLTDMEEASAIAARVATAHNTSATGLNLVARQIGNGLSSELMHSFGGDTHFPIGQAAFALASGVGNATAVGLGLRQQKVEPSQDQSIVGIAGNLGLGVAMPIVSSMDLQATIRSWSNSSSSSDLMKHLPLFAAAAGNGLGKGIRNGFGLKAKEKKPSSENKPSPDKKPSPEKNNSPQKRQAGGPPKNIQKWAKSMRLFTKGLSQSFIEGSNFSDVVLAMRSAVSNSLDTPTLLGNIASGAGAGIGMGVAIGLNLKAGNSTPMISGDITNDELQTAAMAETFTQNLVSNFLMKSSVRDKVSQLVTDNPPQMIRSFELAKAAEGLGRGAIEGTMIAMSSVGGLKYLIDGNFPVDAIEKVPVLAPTQFNDSVSGGAVGLARGLSSTATILVAEIARNFTNGTPTPNKAASERKRSVRYENEGGNVDKLNSFSPRQEQPINGAQMPLAIDPATAQMGAQKVIDRLTCRGVGGIVSAALGFASTSPSDMKMIEAAMGNSGIPLDSTILKILPKGPITVISQGNNFEVVLENRSVKINGQNLTLFAILTGLHVLFTTLAFLVFLPLYVIFGVAWRFSVIAGHPVDETKNKKWRMGFLVCFAVFGTVGIVLGIVGMGNAKHFHDIHGILGLLCLIFLIPAVGSSIARLRTTMPHPSPRAFVGFKGPIELAKSPQRIYFVSGLSIQLLLILGQIAYVQGFTTLRAVSLCVLDAFFTPDSAGSFVGMLLMIQMAAAALSGIRMWLEQHIAKKEDGNRPHPSKINLFKRSKTDTMATFGFDKKDIPPALDIAATRGSDFSRKTEDLKGFEDHAISTPFNFRKEGSITESETRDGEADENIAPFLSVEERNNYQDRGIYNPKTGGYPSYRAYADFYSNQPTYGERRPSSGIFDPQLSPRPPIVPTGPKTTNVSTKDLFPPPMPESDRIRMTQRTQKTVSSRYSRPIDGNVAVRDSYTGYGV